MSQYELFDAAFEDDVAAIAEAVASGADPNMTHPQSGHTPLQAAAQGNSLLALDALLRAGADPSQRFDWRSRVDGRVVRSRTALMYASSGVVVRRLVDAGADVGVVDGNGWTALARAVETARPDVFEELLNSGAKANATLKFGGKSMSIAELIDDKVAHLEKMASSTRGSNVAQMLHDLAEIRGVCTRQLASAKD